MRNFFIGFVVFLLYTIPARWHYVCEIRHLCEDENDNITAISNDTPKRLNTLNLKSGDSTLLLNYEQFWFDKNSHELELTANNKMFLDGIADNLKNNPDAKLEIIGHYFDTEKVTSGFNDNLGIARAVAIRNYLMEEYGFDEKRFKVDYEAVEKGSSEYVDIPLDYNIVVPKLNVQDYKTDDVEYSLPEYTFERMTFSDINFEYNKAKFNPTNSFRFYADSVKQYLALNPEKTIEIVGHADNRGSDETNRVLGLRRANNVIIYLRDSIKIDINKMDSDSKGEKNPIVPNTTEENMRKNRRVEVLIK